MIRSEHFERNILACAFGLRGVTTLACAASLISWCSLADGAQLDIHGPPGSDYFGTPVAVLANGNIVVSDVGATAGLPHHAGAVYLYDPKGNLISTLTGSGEGDRVGDFLVTLPNGNFVVVSPNWNNAGKARAGAVTWVDGTMGLSGAVSAANSFVGVSADDRVGTQLVTVLTNGNFVIPSPYWNGGAGAATWVNGATGGAGVVSPANSLVGSVPGDEVGSLWGGITPLANGNYVVGSPFWSDGAVPRVGAATWADGSHGLAGFVSASNSLIGSTTFDSVGFSAAALSNGNYVVASPNWSNGATQYVGAATWADGSVGLVGRVSASNSLIGSSPDDYVAAGCACTWEQTIVPLTNGNYVVRSSNWSNGGIARVGAATWGNGATGLIGTVAPGNSLTGSKTDDRVSDKGVTALANGNYVVASDYWGGAGGAAGGAATWGNGTTGVIGAVSEDNSLVGAGYYDQVTSGGVVALSNGNYVVGSPGWSDGVNSKVGAVTWGNGATGISGRATTSNSLVGSANYDHVGIAHALSNGNYVVTSPGWNGAMGAVTWGSGGGGPTGPITALNSFIGSSHGDYLGMEGVQVFPDGNYAIISQHWNQGRGAITFGRGDALLLGTVTTNNSVIGGLSGGGSTLVSAYDVSRKRLVVGQPQENLVTLWDAENVFADGFEH